MFGLLRRSAPGTGRGKAPPRLARPRLEVLEAREVPTATLTLSVQYGADRQVVLYGTLSDHPNPSLQTIHITGKVEISTETNSLGQFSVMGIASGLGDVSAYAADNSSDVPTVTLTDVAPTLTFEVFEEMGHVWALEGDVTYHRGAGDLTVYFGGAPVSLQNQTTMTDGAGHYEFDVMLNGQPSDNGPVWAKVISPWGLESAYEYEDISQTGT